MEPHLADSVEEVSIPERKTTEGAGRNVRAATARSKQAGNERWIAKVKTDSTHPLPRLFTKSAATIARTLASKKVSPKGPGSGMRMLSYCINRGGKRLTSERRAELEKAKILLSNRMRSGKRSKPDGH